MKQVPVFNKVLFFVIPAILLVSPLLGAQKNKIKWGKIPKTDLKMKIFKPFPEAEAVILEDFRTYEMKTMGVENFHQDLNTIDYKINRLVRITHHRRIKILKQPGLEYGQIEIRLREEEKFNIKAQIINPAGEIITCKQDDLFEITDGKNHTIKWVIPNLKVSDILEIKYVIETDEVFQLPTCRFQTSIPVRTSQLELKLESNLNYFWIQKGNMEIDYDGKIFTLSNIPPLKPEPYITNLEDNRIQLQFFLSSVNLDHANDNEKMFQDWQELANWTWEHPNFGEQWRISSNYSKAWRILEERINPSITPLEKAKFIYYFVQKEMKVSSSPSYVIDVFQPLDTYFEKKRGNANEINLLLMALLNKARIKVSPVLISERWHGSLTNIHPHLEQFNSTIILAQINGKNYLLDASDKHLPFGIPRIEALNGLGWVVDPVDARWINIQAPEGSSFYMVNFHLNETGGGEGDFSARLKGYDAVAFRAAMKEKEREDVSPLNFLNSDWEVKNINVENGFDLENPIDLEATISYTEKDNSVASTIYFEPVISQYHKSPFQQEQRQLPIDLIHPISEICMINITFPEHYTMIELPESISCNLPNGGGQFQFQCKQMGNLVQIQSTLKIVKERYTLEEYPALKQFFEVVAEKLSEKITFQRKR